MKFDSFKEGIDQIENGLRLLMNQSPVFEIKRLLAAEELLLTKYAPFLEGDRVCLAKTPDIESSSGWFRSKHFLITGALGIVRGVECHSEGRLVYYVEFDDETYYCDNDKIYKPTSKKHVYGFGESWIKKVEEVPHHSV